MPVDPITPEELREVNFVLGDRPSDGEILCTGCWDDGHEPRVNMDIPKGQPVFYARASYEYDEWDAYCTRCTRQRLTWNREMGAVGAEKIGHTKEST